jgi:uncharacterized protein (DUF1778 family)
VTAIARFDLKMDAKEKEFVARAAALLGTTMSAFVRSAAKEKARELLDRDARITLSEHDFQAFNLAICGAFTPNPALENAINMAGGIRVA